MITRLISDLTRAFFLVLAVVAIAVAAKSRASTADAVASIHYDHKSLERLLVGE